jgi:CysZ protein
LLKEIFIAIHAYFKAHAIVWKKQNKAMWIMGIFYSCLFMVALYIFFTTFTRFSDLLVAQTNIKNWLQSSNTLLHFFFITSLVMFNLVVFIYYFGICKYVYLLLFAPIYSYIRFSTNSGVPFTAIHLKEIFSLSKHTALNLLKNLFWQTLYTLLFLVLTLVPLVGWVIPLIALLTEFYYFGYTQLDYTLYQKKYTPQTIATYINQHKGLAIGNGLLFYALHIIPLLGWIVAPYYALAAADLSIDAFEQ